MKYPDNLRGRRAVAGFALLAGGAMFVFANASDGSITDVTGITEHLPRFLSFEQGAFWTLFAALFAIMNPIIAIPMFVRVTAKCREGERRWAASLVAVTVLSALFIAMLIGDQLLGFFAISIGAFRIAGGVIVLLMGLAMLRTTQADDDADARGSRSISGEARSQSICPIAIPLLAGPGAIATIILQVQTAGSAQDYAMIISVVVVIVAMTYAALRVAVPIARALGPTGLMVITRVTGMFVAAIAIDMMVTGLKASFAGSF